MGRLCLEITFKIRFKIILNKILNINSKLNFERSDQKEIKIFETYNFHERATNFTYNY